MHLRVVMLLAVISILTLGLLALPSPPQGGNPIIIKGGSLSIACPDGAECFDSPGDGHHSHKKPNGKIHHITVKAEDGTVLGEWDMQQLGGKPEIDILYY